MGLIRQLGKGKYMKVVSGEVGKADLKSV